MLLTLVVLIFVILYFLMYKKETFIKYDENIFFGLNKDKNPMYQLDLKLSKARNLQKLINSLEKSNESVVNDKTGAMVLNSSCIPREPKFVPQNKGYDEYSSLGFSKDKHLKNYEFKNLIDHLYSP